MDMLKGGSDITLADMLNGMSDMADIADMALLSGMLVGRGNWSGFRQPLMGRGCSIPGTKPGFTKCLRPGMVLLNVVCYKHFQGENPCIIL